MSLVLNDEQQMLMDAATKYFSQQASINEFRNLRSQELCFDVDIWQDISKFAWPEILAPEELGGLGFGISGLTIIAIEAGKNLSVSPLFTSAALSMTALLQCQASSQRDSLIQSVSAGQAKLVLADSETHRFNLQKLHCQAIETDRGYILTGAKSFVAEGNHADSVLVLAKLNDSIKLFLVDSQDADVTKSSITLMDQRDYSTLQFNNVQLNKAECLEWQDDESKALDSILNVGALIAGAELFGIASEAFERTRVYLGDREQFGQKIGSFQALQHRMAYAYSQIEILKSVLFDAMHAIETNREDASLAASHCKTLANQTARLVTQEAIQMHGGIGITDELDIGLFYKRARVLQASYGDTNYHKNRFASLNGY